MFKKIYVEITNYCNLNCSFCSKDSRVRKEMSLSEFESVIRKIDKYTDYVYLHVKGEPLFHSDIGGILNICRKYNKKVNITTNGTLLESKLDVIINNNDVIRQINISIHSMPSNKKYLDMVSSCVMKILDSSNIIISLRLWNIAFNIDKNMDVYDYLRDRFMLDDLVYMKMKSDMKIKLRDRLYLNKDRVFVWPSLSNSYYSEVGKCYGTISHVGILSDGTVVPCCLDSDGIINLGNIFVSDFDSIINSEMFILIRNGFRENRKICKLCKKCSFLDK